MAVTILVTGGLGKVGSAVAQRLRTRGVEPRVAVRRAPASGQVRLEWGDPTTYETALDGAAAVFLVAPTDRIDHLDAMEPFLRTAVARPDRRMVLLSAASLEKGDPMMGDVHAWLQAHAPHWVVLRPSWFMQNFTTQHLDAIRSEGRIYSATSDGRVAFIDVDDIAAVAVEALLGLVPNGDIVLTGPEVLSYDDVAATITRVADRPVRHHRITAAELIEHHERQGLPRDFAELLAGMDVRIAAGAEDRATDAVARLTGRRRGGSPRSRKRRRRFLGRYVKRRKRVGRRRWVHS